MAISTRLTFLICLLPAVACNGCGRGGPERVPVAGIVTIDGEPLATGTIRFVPEIGRPASSTILSDGSFVLADESVRRESENGLPPGKYRVQVASSEVVDDETIRWNAPQKYADFRTSGLIVQVDQAIEDLAIELTWAHEIESTPRPDANAAGPVTGEDSDAAAVLRSGEEGHE